MNEQERFAEAIKRIDEANSKDPRTQRVDGSAQPRELLFARRVYAWVEKLVEQPSETLLLAARAHTIRRWTIERNRYPMDTAGYHKWRNALAAFHATETGRILAEVGYPAEKMASVKSLIVRENWSADAEGRALEDADCLAFLEMKLHDYRDQWDEAKAVRILKGTLRKMTPQAVAFAQKLSFAPQERVLLEQAGLSSQAGSRCNIE